MPSRHRLRSTALTVLIAAVCAGLSASSASAGTPRVTLFPQPGAITGLTAGPDGRIWFTSGSEYGRIDANGNIRRGGLVALGGPITAGPDGNLWTSLTSSDQIVSVAPDTELQTIVGGGITTGANPAALTAAVDGNVWFVEGPRDSLGRITPGGTVTEFLLVAGSTPQDIAAGSDGFLWVTQPGRGSIAKVSALNGAVAGEFLSSSGSPSSISPGPDGNLWYTTTDGKIVRLTTAGDATAFTIPGAGVSTPSDIVAGPDGNLWFGDISNKKIGRITPSGVITEFAIDLDPADFPCHLTAGADGAVWFSTCGAFATTHQIGRITTGVAPPRYTDSLALKVPATGTSGEASAYPSTIDVDGLQGTVTKVTVRLNGVHHARASDLLVQLVGPQGQSSILMANATSRIGDAGTPPDALDGDVVTFSSDGVDPQRRLTSGIFKPLDPGFLLSFTPPAPANFPAPPANLGVFNGTAPNGAWKLFVIDDEAGAGTTGAIAGGWSLDIQTSGPTVEVPGPTTTVTVPGPTVTNTVNVAGPTPQSDTAPPVLTLGKLPTSLPLATLRKGLSVQVTSSEAATLEGSLNAAVRKATLARLAPSSSPLELDASTTQAKAGAATKLTLKPAAKLLGKPRKAFTVELRLRATDAAGNRATVSRRIKITLAKASKTRR